MHPMLRRLMRVDRQRSFSRGSSVAPLLYRCSGFTQLDPRRARGRLEGELGFGRVHGGIPVREFCDEFWLAGEQPIGDDQTMWYRRFVFLDPQLQIDATPLR